MNINYLSEFKLLESPSGVDTSAPFKFSYYTPQSVPYVASWDGNEYINCRREEDGSLLVIFENHNLNTGVLMVRRDYFLSDSDFSDGICNISSVEKSGVELTTHSSTSSSTQVDVITPYMQGLSAYEIALENGFVGDESEWLESLTPTIEVIYDFIGEEYPLEPNKLYYHHTNYDPNLPEVFIRIEDLDNAKPTDEYMMIFTTPDSIPYFYYPSSVQWVGEVDSSGAPVLRTNTTYEVNIVEKRGIIIGW